jgi:intracellular septation protein A
MKIWTYRFDFMIDGLTYRTEAIAQLKTVESRVFQGEQELANDSTDVMTPDGMRNHQLRFSLSDGREVAVETGYIDWFRIGMAVRVNGTLVHESHPGKVIGFPTVSVANPEAAAKLQAEQSAAWSRNKYSIYVDVGIGILFFVLVKLTDDLPFSALATAGAGLAVVVVQRFVKVDLLGGLALFGVVMLLISAGFSWYFDNDWAVKMKSTILGVFVATLMLSDAMFNRGRYFGGRLLRFMPQPMEARRLATGMGVLGLVMAAVNWAFAEFTSQDTWLYYTSFGDFVLTMFLVFAVFRYASIR